MKGDGKIATEHRTIAEITSIDSGGAFEIQWSSGAPALAVTTDGNILPHIHTKVSGQTLKISTDGSIAPTKGVRVVISSAALDRLDLTGAVHLVAQKVSASAFSISSAGATTIEIDGSATTLAVNLTGASRLNAAGLQTKTAKVNLVGASSGDVAVSDALDATVTGAGSLTYSGEPKSVERQLSGAGSIHHK
ncbi:MAG TPA: DUF2807 domain-containing protein [Chthoniobacter sp.]|nr:DUF2807 domain-containing protein [Chthoniobacter sp.]